jgi:ABC transport system ATP-binding/permease protein
LLLARLFARPANILVLDEPTNDLDIETLELLEELLQDYPGTVLLVSHDRTFLDNVVTQTIASEGNGRWKDFVGGFADWERQRKTTQGPSAIAQLKAAAQLQDQVATPTAITSKPQETLSKASSTSTATTHAKGRPNKLAPWEVKELEELPLVIQKLEQEQESLVAEMGNGELYKNDPAKLTTIQTRLTEIDALLLKHFARWEALEARQS